MKIAIKIFLTSLIFGAFAIESQAQDWPNLNYYREANRSIMEARHNDPNDSQKNWVVFMGDSGTQGWTEKDPDFFTDNHFIGRGINGQTTPQMLLRFRQDVIELSPKVVVILGGANDMPETPGRRVST